MKVLLKFMHRNNIMVTKIEPQSYIIKARKSGKISPLKVLRCANCNKVLLRTSARYRTRKSKIFACSNKCAVKVKGFNKGRTPEEFNKHFWLCVDKSPGLGPRGDCWHWIAALDRYGYGTVSFRGGTKSSHRVVWILVHNEDISSKDVICHKCDNPTCVRPDHLFKGTQLDNIKDMLSKGRQSKGSQKYFAKIDERIAYGIKFVWTNIPRKYLANMFDLHIHTILTIQTSKTWKHITDDCLTDFEIAEIYKMDLYKFFYKCAS